MGGFGNFTNMAAASPCRSSRIGQQDDLNCLPCLMKLAGNESVAAIVALATHHQYLLGIGVMRQNISATVDPAFSISVKDGTPKRSLVARSMARISAAVTIFI